MRNLLLLALVSCSSAYANVEQPLAPPIVLDHEVVVSPFVRTAPPVVQHTALARYALDLMNRWPRTKAQAADYEAIAESIATAAADDAEPYEAAALLAAVGYMESGFAAYVDSGACNRWMKIAYSCGVEAYETSPAGVRYRRVAPSLACLDQDKRDLLQSGNCDGGQAYSIFQVHPYCSGWRHDGCVTAEQLADRATAARVALRLIRLDPSLTSYTGESRSWHPKADQRRNFALTAMRRQFRSLTPE